MSSDKPDITANGNPESAAVGPDAAASEVAPEPSRHPPIAPGALQRPRQEPAWPMVLGIISIVFGGVGVLVYLWGTLAPFLLKS